MPISASEFFTRLPEKLRAEGVRKTLERGTLRSLLAGRDPKNKEFLYHESAVDRLVLKLEKPDEVDRIDP